MNYADLPIEAAIGGVYFPPILLATVSGVVLGGAFAKRHKTGYLLESERVGDTLAVVTWMCFGAAMA